MRSEFSVHQIVIIHLLLGAVIGVILLHPIAMAVTWSELRVNSVITNDLWEFMLSRFATVFSARVLPMTLGYAFVGSLVGFFFALQTLSLARKSRAVRTLSNFLGDDLTFLIHEGENELIEFKASLRWDFKKDAMNRSLEVVIAKTLAGFMNHRGGSLIIGVTDAGKIIGLEKDFQTLKHKNRDGFERCIMDIVSKKLDVHKCTLIHCMFHDIEGQDVCRVLVEPTPDPVYLNDGRLSKYFVRTGNGTREFDTREALTHILQRSQNKQNE